MGLFCCWQEALGPRAYYKMGPPTLPYPSVTGYTVNKIGA